MRYGSDRTRPSLSFTSWAVLVQPRVVQEEMSRLMTFARCLSLHFSGRSMRAGQQERHELAAHEHRHRLRPVLEGTTGVYGLGDRLLCRRVRELRALLANSPRRLLVGAIGDGVEVDGVSAQDAGGVLLFVVHPGEERFEASANDVKWVATSNMCIVILLLPYCSHLSRVTSHANPLQ